MERNKKIHICPFTAEPDEECYCININSLRVYRVIDYCAGDFRLCPVYEKLSKGQRVKKSVALINDGVFEEGYRLSLIS